MESAKKIDLANLMWSERYRPKKLREVVNQKEIIKGDRKSTRLNSSHANISYAVFCLKKTTRYSGHSTNTAASTPTPSRTCSSMICFFPGSLRLVSRAHSRLVSGQSYPCLPGHRVGV